MSGVLSQLELRDTPWRMLTLAEAFGDLGRRTLIMGVVNVTPDSFSDGGRFVDPVHAVELGRSMVDAGADIVDVGGESTRPGSDAVSAEVEIARVVPVIAGMVDAGLSRISIDTTKASVAEAALSAGATIVNDISGLSFDPELVHVAVAHRAFLVLSHIRGQPKNMQSGPIAYSEGVVPSVRRYLESALERAVQAGMSPQGVFLDPGIGFGKTIEQNLELLRNLRHLRVQGCPVLVGTSRKSFLGTLTGRPVHDREFGTAATVALSVAAGADAVRVHDVGAMRDVVRVADAWVRGAASTSS